MLKNILKNKNVSLFDFVLSYKIQDRDWYSSCHYEY